MNNVYFNDLFSVIKNQLLSAKKYVKIAVCWINFDMFMQTFYKLINAEVSIDIIISEHPTNHKYDQRINELNSYGHNKIMITYAYIPSALMHEKFCIIDGKKVLVGSYNWTWNATVNNFENLLIVEDPFVVNKFEFEFYEIMSLDFHYFTAQRRNQRRGLILVATVEQEGNDQSCLSIYKIEDGYFDPEPKYTEYYDISLYSELDSIGSEYYEEYEQDQINGLNSDINDVHSKWEFDLHKFMINSFPQIQNAPYIHALGVVCHQLYFKNYEDVYLKIIWKNRFIAHFIDDRYDLP